MASLAGCKPHSTEPVTNSSSVAGSESKSTEIKELGITDLTVGAGEALAAGETAVVHYTGWLYDPAQPEQKGAKFDSSRDRGEPFRFNVGQSQVIAGWDQGVVGMKIGGQR